MQEEQSIENRTLVIQDLEHYNSVVSASAKAGIALIVIDFSAKWCGPCKAIGPFYDQLAQQYQSVLFLKVDVDEADDLAMEMNVLSMPTFVFVKDGQEVHRFSGANKQALEQSIQQLE